MVIIVLVVPKSEVVYEIKAGLFVAEQPPFEQDVTVTVVVP